MPEAETKQQVLFLSTHNSARSQMAEGSPRALGGERFDAFFAGTEATRVRPLAVRAIAELGIDISEQASKTPSASSRLPIESTHGHFTPKMLRVGFSRVDVI